MTRPVLAYTLLRCVLFVGALGLAVLAGLRGVVSIFAALILSAIASAVLLTRQRDAIAAAAAVRKAAALGERERLQARLREDDPAT